MVSKQMHIPPRTSQKYWNMNILLDIRAWANIVVKIFHRPQFPCRQRYKERKIDRQIETEQETERETEIYEQDFINNICNQTKLFQSISIHKRSEDCTFGLPGLPMGRIYRQRIVPLGSWVRRFEKVFFFSDIYSSTQQQTIPDMGKIKVFSNIANPATQRYKALTIYFTQG